MAAAVLFPHVFENNSTQPVLPRKCCCKRHFSLWKLFPFVQQQFVFSSIHEVIRYLVVCPRAGGEQGGGTSPTDSHPPSYELTTVRSGSLSKKLAQQWKNLNNIAIFMCIEWKRGPSGGPLATPFRLMFFSFSKKNCERTISARTQKCSSLREIQMEPY